MQRLDFFNWKEVKVGEKFQGRMHLRTNNPQAVYLESEGYQILVGYGTEFEVSFDGEAALMVYEPPKGFEMWAHVKDRVSFEPKGEIYMNVDRKPNESVAMQEVRRALRELEIGKRQALAEISEAQRIAKAERKALKAAKKAIEAEAEAEAEAATRALEGSPDAPQAD